jgi:hypothetical protein
MDASVRTAAFALLQIKKNTATMRRYILNPHLTFAMD